MNGKGSVVIIVAKRVLVTCVILALAVVVPGSIVPAAAVQVTPTLVPTFESVGIYWKPDAGSSSSPVSVRYAVAGSGDWKAALPLWYDSRDSEYRGSLVLLEPGTSYDVELTKDDGQVAVGEVTTWSEDFPVAETVTLPEQSDTTLVINDSGLPGCPGGYTLYTHAPGGTATIDVADAHLYNVDIDGSCIIIRGLTLRGAQKNIIRLSPDTHDVIIEESDLSNWGRLGDVSQGFGKNDGAIDATSPNSNPNLKRITIQRNRIHHPRWDTNSWDEFNNDSNTKHPTGPQAIQLHNSGGNHVFRYNEIFSDPAHQFNDALGGFRNFSNEGFPGPDTDIYGNILTHCWDECIEVEGGGMNVRIWGNYIDRSFPKIGMAPVGKGPLYVFRNILDRGQFGEGRGFGFGPVFKGGNAIRNGVLYGDGAIFVFHNTQLQRGGTDGSIDGFIMSHNAGSVNNFTAFNNIIHVRRRAYKDGNDSCSNRLDYNLYSGTLENNCASTPHEQHGIFGTPTYNQDAPPPGSKEGDYSLSPGTAGHDDGTLIPNFNNDFEGTAPDIGAHEAGTPPMQFGVDAYRGAPPELFNAVQASSGAITVDGSLSEPEWKHGQTDLPYNLSRVISGTWDNTVRYSMLWDSEYLYVSARVLDGNLFNDSANTWEDDGVVVFIDGDHSHGPYDVHDNQYNKGWNDPTLFAKDGVTTGVLHAWAAVEGGYQVELGIPWANLTVTPVSGATIGFDIANNDDDTGGTRDGQAMAFGTSNNSQDTTNFGDLTLIEPPPPPSG